MEYLLRHISPTVVGLLAVSPIVVIQGARQVGKSTLADHLSGERDATSVTLDDPLLLQAALTDPVNFVTRTEQLLIIDEVQRAPELIVALKLVVDRDRRPGRFLLTGSSDLLSLRGAGDTLAGRIESVRLDPLSQGELHGCTDRFIDALFSGDLRAGWESSLTRADYSLRACIGGFPNVVERTSTRLQQSWLGDYRDRVTARAGQDGAHIRDLRRLPIMLRLIAMRQGSDLNVADIARDAAMPERSVPEVIRSLETLFLIRRLPAWSTNLTKRIASRPKVYLVDSGLAASLMGVHASRLATDVDPKLAGGLFEGFVVGEIDRQREWNEQTVAMYHFRDRDGAEIDIVLETPDGRIAAIEVKASATPGARSTKWLQLLRDRLGKRFVAGVVLHTGGQAVSFGDRLWALPMSTVWDSHP